MDFSEEIDEITADLIVRKRDTLCFIGAYVDVRSILTVIRCGKLWDGLFVLY